MKHFTRHKLITPRKGTWDKSITLKEYQEVSLNHTPQGDVG